MTNIGRQFIEEVAEYVTAKPGCRSPEIGLATGRAAKAVQRAVASLIKEGRIEEAGEKMARRFGPPGFAAHSVETIVMEMIRRETGAALREIATHANVSKNTISRVLRKLCSAGKIEQGQDDGSLKSSRWYLKGKVSALPKRRILKPIIDRRSTKPHGEVVVPSNVKIQYGPSFLYDPRYQVPPSTRIAGGFADMGIGRYLAPDAASDAWR